MYMSYMSWSFHGVESLPRFHVPSRKKIRHGYVKTLRVDVKWTRSGREGTEISLMHFFYAVVIDNAYSQI